MNRGGPLANDHQVCFSNLCGVKTNGNLPLPLQQQQASTTTHRRVLPFCAIWETRG